MNYVHCKDINGEDVCVGFQDLGEIDYRVLGFKDQTSFNFGPRYATLFVVNGAVTLSAVSVSLAHQSGDPQKFRESEDFATLEMLQTIDMESFSEALSKVDEPDDPHEHPSA